MDTLSHEKRVCDELSASAQRILVMGSPGSDRASLVTALAETMLDRHGACAGLSADPALPLFGVPGALNFGQWQNARWETLDTEALCSLDSARFRLPLLTAFNTLLLHNNRSPLLVQAPGLARGVASAELLPEMIAAARIDTVLVLLSPKSAPPLAGELAATGATVLHVESDTAPPGQRKTHAVHQRSRLWQHYMKTARSITLDLGELQFLGTPPPRDAAGAWPGRQVALLHAGRLQSMGEVTGLGKSEIQLKVAHNPGKVEQLLIRDALYTQGVLRTAKPHNTTPVKPPERPEVGFLPSGTAAPMTKVASGGYVPAARIGPATAVLINGVFGDPLLKVQLHHQRRSLLFDLGDPGRLAARVAHQVRDIFFTHAHADHIGGFLWFLRSRIGEFEPCRCYGPPGLAKQITGMTNGVLWDRVEHRAPRFEVREWHGDHLKCFRITADSEAEQCLADEPLQHGILWHEPQFVVRATALDHGTPVLAYALEPALEIKVRRDRLHAKGLKYGRWLQDFKRYISSGTLDSDFTLPDGSISTVAELRDELLLIAPGRKLVYATDFADTAGNREQLIALAANAHTFFCEASFMEKDRAQAERTQHLTTSTCAEIANAAKVAHLVPFHFSNRYAKQPREIYRELSAICSRTVVPRR